MITYSVEEVKQDNLIIIDSIINNSPFQNLVINPNKICEIDYSKYTIKELLRIAEYYREYDTKNKEFRGNKDIKKWCKEQIIIFLISFESKLENKEIVTKRKEIWIKIEELKKDKFMKRFIIW